MLDLTDNSENNPNGDVAVLDHNSKEKRGVREGKEKDDEIDECEDSG